jgi:PAS domain S-box-containing protein
MSAPISAPESIEILVVEDSPTQAELLKYILAEHGYHVAVARNGREALASLRQHQPTMVISDVVMPEMDGYQLCRHIKEAPHFKDMPVILLTTLADPVNVLMGLACGADNFIAKPYDAQYLLYRVAYILTNWHRRSSHGVQMGSEIFFAGQRFFITADRPQILNFLLSTYEMALQQNTELVKVQAALKELNQQLEAKVHERTAALEAEIAERKRTEEALRESEAQYRDLFENANDILYTLDLTGTFTSLNRMGERISGYTRDEARTLHVSRIVAPGDAERIQQVLTHQLRGTDATTCEVAIVAKDGHRVGLEVNSRLIYQQGKIVGMQGIARDITERQHLEQQLRQSQKMEAIGRLAGGVAHDFNNLLTVISGYSDLLLRHLDNRELMRQEIDVIKKAGDRAAALTRQLLAFSRKQVLQPRVLNLNTVVTDSTKILHRLIGEDIELVTVLDPALGYVHADPGQMEQVIMNLAVNARDAMPQGGHLIIETTNVYLDEEYARRHVSVQTGHYVLLAVSDTGCGMDAVTQLRVFEPFFTTKAPGEGTGLGLSTCYGIVQQSGGSIWVYSELGHGTTFKIYLPRFEEPTMRGETPTLPSAVPHGSETVLVVEDEVLVQRLTCELLRLQGYTVLVATSANEALQICEGYNAPIHLVLTDVVMPRMSGPELIQRLTLLRPGIRVLYMSGYTDNAVMHHGLPHTGAPFLQKPFTPHTLAHKVREVLDPPAPG